MESSSNNSPSPKVHRYNTRYKRNYHLINYNEDSDVSDNDYIDSDNDDNDDNNDDDDEQLQIYEYRQLLGDLFPSQYMNNKIKDTKVLRNAIQSKRFRINKGLNYSTNIIISKSPKLALINGHQNKIMKNEDKDYNDNEEDDENDEDETDDEDDDEDSEDIEDSEDEEDDDEDSDDEDDEDDNGEDAEDEEYEDDDEDVDIGKDDKKNLKYLTHKLIMKDKSKDLLNNLVKMANQKYKMNQMKKTTNKSQNMIKKIKKEKIKEEKIKINNAKEFRKLLMEKDNLNDLKFFKNSLTMEDQTKLIEELKKINEVSNVDKPYRIILLESDIPQVFKVAALKKISMMENMDPSVGEYFKLKNWVDTFMRIPFNKFNNLPFNITNGLDKCNEYMEQSISTLNSAVYGLNDAKLQIMQLIGQWIVNPDAIGSAIAIKGPMGTGKTTLVKEGISKILNRPFSLIALGGATDSSVLEGHGYTYEGSMWGKIVDILIQTKCSNPIIYFDELDKVSDTPRGEEIIGILTHLIDSTQNGTFHDKYFSEIDFDLSKALFIFSYNDESKVNPILLDRMYKIATKGYDLNEKKIIAKEYLIPTIYKQIKFESDNIIILDETLTHIIEKYTVKEDGVRNLKRCLEIIYTKLNLFRLMKPESALFKEEKSLNVEFPFTVTPEIVDKLIKKESEGNDNWKRMYM
jgi:ATP-dependent Lon protease